MNSRTEQIIRKKLIEHEQREGDDTSLDSLWGQMEVKSFRPARKESKLYYAFAGGITLLVIVSGITMLLMRQQEPIERVADSRPAVAVTKPVPDETKDTDRNLPGMNLPEETVQSGKGVMPECEEIQNGKEEDDVTEYLREMDLPSLAGLYAGKEDMLQTVDEHSGNEWICY